MCNRYSFAFLNFYSHAILLCMKDTNNLIWIDLEMTGLDPEQDVILEIATIITDGNLHVLAQGQSIVIHYDQAVLDAMNEWCIEHHAKSGLTKAVQESTTTLIEAMEETLELIKAYCPEGRGVLCGNSIWQDRIFLQRYMPEILQYINYKMVDVTSIQQLIKRWYPNNVQTAFKKKELHRALPDIQESIEELRHYRNTFFVKSSQE